MPDPEGLLTGTGKKARHIKFKTPDEIDHPAVRALLEAAVNPPLRPEGEGAGG